LRRDKRVLEMDIEVKAASGRRTTSMLEASDARDSPTIGDLIDSG